MPSLTYLDHAATTPLLPAVAEKISSLLPLLTSGELGNASALHSAGQRAKQEIEAARIHVARLINADPAEIIFTSGGSEANNTVTNVFRYQNIVASSIEHPSLLESAHIRAARLTLLPVDQNGLVQCADIPADTNLVSIMLANNELGTIQPIAQIAQQLTKLPSGQRPYFHTDATQALGKVHLDVKTLGIDYLTISAHKIGGPIGIGALYVRKSAPYHPLIIGGHQEHRRRAGTLNTLLIAGFGEAARLAWENWSCEQYRKLAKLRNTFAQRILSTIPHSSINGYAECIYDAKTRTYNTLPNLLNVSFAAAEGESIQLYLDLAGIEVSTGSACASGDTQPSHVLMATTHDAEVAHSSIRFSFSPDATTTDLDRVMSELPTIVQRLQGISTIKLPEEL